MKPQQWLGVLLALLLCIGSGHAAAPLALRFTTADGLPSNAVHQIIEDRAGYLWFATDDGLARFDGHRFRVWRLEQGLADNRVLSLALDVHDRLWMGTANGTLMRLSADREQIAVLAGPQHPGLRGSAITVLLAERNGTLWVGTRSAGLFRRDPTGHLQQFLPPAYGDGLPAGEVVQLAQGNDGLLWVGTSTGVAAWREGRFQPLGEVGWETAAVNGLAVDTAGTLWVSTAKQLWRRAPGERLQPVRDGGRVRVLASGRHHALWLAQGKHVWRRDGAGTESERTALAALDSGARPRFRRAFEDRQGGVWLLGTHLGVWRLPPRWQHFRVLGAPPAMSPGWQLRASGHAQVRELYCAPDHRWRWTARGLERWDRRGRIRAWDWSRLGLEANGTSPALHCDGAQGVWLGDRVGLRRWNGERFERLPGAPAGISAVLATADNALWLAVPGRVQRYRLVDGRLLPAESVGTREGLPLLSLVSLALDGQGVLWGSSVRGLVRIQTRPMQVSVLSRSDGVPEPVHAAVLHTTGDAILAIGTDGTLVAFDPAALALPTPPPALVIERIALRRDGALVSVPPVSPLLLRADDRDIQVTVRLLSGEMEAPRDYRFRLLGPGQPWSRAGKRGTRALPQLPPGEHVLEYQARGSDGAWMAAQRLAIQVPRTAWQHPVMPYLLAGLLALLLLGATWFGWRWAVRIRQRRTAAQRQVWAAQTAQAKARYLATFGHEIRTPLTGVLGMSELLLASSLAPAQRRQVEQVRCDGEHLLQIVNQALDDARLDAGRVPLQACVFDLEALLRQWQQCLQVDVGTALALRMHLPGGARVHGDPQRLRQLLHALTQGLVAALAPTQVALQAGWLPGRSGVLLDWRVEASASASLTASALHDTLRHVEGLTRALGASLQAPSTSARGWQLVVSLPLIGTDEGEAVIAGREAEAGRAIGRVLLVEDDPLLAEVTARLLEAQGVQVARAAHALAALAELAAADVDGVLLDLDLPGIDGWQLLEMLRGQGCTAPVVILTARHDPALAGRAARAGAAGLLHKPVGAAVLLAALRGSGAG